MTLVAILKRFLLTGTNMASTARGTTGFTTKEDDATTVDKAGLEVTGGIRNRFGKFVCRLCPNRGTTHVLFVETTGSTNPNRYNKELHRHLRAGIHNCFGKIAIRGPLKFWNYSNNY